MKVMAAARRGFRERWAALLLAGTLGALGCGASGGGQPRDGSGAGGSADSGGSGGAMGTDAAAVDCAAVCARTGELCADTPVIDGVWLDACRSQCQARVRLLPDVAALEAACVAAASACDVAVLCVATPTAPGGPGDGGGADRADARQDGGGGGGGGGTRGPDAGPNDAPADAAFGPPMVRATIDGTPVVFDRMTRASVLADVILVQAWTSDLSRTIIIETAGGVGVLRRLPATYGCTNSGGDLGWVYYTVYGPGGPDAGAGQTYGETPYGSRPCSVVYTRVDTRIQATFVATPMSPAGSVVITGGVIDVAGL